MSFWEDNLHLPNKDWHTEAVFSAHKEFISTLFQMGVCFKTHKPRNLAPDPLSGHCSLDSLWPWAEMFVKLRIFIVWIVQDFSKPPISISVLIDRQSRLCCELGRYKGTNIFTIQNFRNTETASGITTVGYECTNCLYHQHQIWQAVRTMVKMLLLTLLNSKPSLTPNHFTKNCLFMRMTLSLRHSYVHS